MNAYFSNGGTILLTDKDIAKTYYKDTSLGRIAGLHDARENIIYIANSKADINSTLIHEFGHVLDSMTNWDSMKNDFNSIYTNEKDTLEVVSLDGHYKANQREFFAEVFQESIINSESCKKTAPKAFDFVNKKINELS